MAPNLGLFLGAGASYEIGLPLVNGLTEELKSVLTPAVLRGYEEAARSTQPIATDVVEDLIQLLSVDSMHYEAILGRLQVEATRNQELRQSYSHLANWMLQTVYLRLYRRHVRHAEFILGGLRYLDGIAGLVRDNTPLWIFSLNHDCIIECVAASLSIPLSCGLIDHNSLPLRDASGRITGQLPIQTMSGDSFRTKGFQFFQHGTSGINLLKIHGGLEMFMTREGEDFLRVLPAAAGPAAVLESLRLANTDLRLASGLRPGITNEIMCDDAAGNTIMLRRSLLAGAYKFEQRGEQVLPKELLGVFEGSLLYVGHLVCLGYGFGDVHINMKMRAWLEAFSFRRLTIVSPAISVVPSSLLHLTPQIEIVKATATSYLRTFSLNPWTSMDDLMKLTYDATREWLETAGEAR